MNKKIYLGFGIVITILISYGIALIAFVLDNTDAIKWGEILSDGTTFASRLSVPVVLAIWSHNKSISDKIELKRKEDREIILAHVKKHLEPLASTFDQKEKELTEEELKNLLGQFSIWFLYLQYSVRYLSYSYMDEYFYLLSVFSRKITKSKNLSKKELEDFYIGISGLIYLIPSLLQSDENQYQKEVIETVDIFIEEEGNIRDITLEVLKGFPEYHEYALKYIEEQKQQQQAK